MSELIDEELMQRIDWRERGFSEKKVKQHSISYAKSTQQKRDKCYKELLRITSHFNSDFVIKYSPITYQIIEVRLLLTNQSIKNFSLLIVLDINLTRNTVETTFQLMETQKIYKVETIDKRVIVCKLFSKSNSKKLSKLVISLFQGNLKIIRPTLNFTEIEFIEFINGKCKQNNLAKLIKSYIKDGFNAFKPLLRHLAPSLHIQDNDTHYHTVVQNHQKHIYRYIIKSSIQPTFNLSFDSFDSGKYQTIQQLANDEKRLTNSMVQNIITDFNEFSSYRLYIKSHVSFQRKKTLYNKQYFELLDDERKELKQKIELSQLRFNLGIDSKFINNMIQINEAFPVNLKKINNGGFADINISEVQFWSLLSVNQNKNTTIIEVKKQHAQSHKQKNNKIRKKNRKILVFKSNNFKGIQAGRNRIYHQMKIISKFKGNSSIFIPEYYKIVNPKSPFLHYILMQHLPYMNLSEYVDAHKFSLSFLTKIHLSHLIVCGLQVLKNSGVIHLDLKPSNIIVGKRMVVKLIDFGESYHKEVCQNTFKPAFSNPYGCPEIFQGMGKVEYSEKNDIYSWGMLFFQMMFKKFPFLFVLQKTAKILKQRSYMKKIYYVPQEQEKYGCEQIVSLLRDIIFRSLDPHTRLRPYTTWLSVVLKQCMSYMIGLEHILMND